jgi:hypothetical protein
MARDSHTALVALNRFGFGARGGASGDLVNAASGPRGFVKAELGRPNGVLRRRARAGGNSVPRQRAGETDEGIAGVGSCLTSPPLQHRHARAKARSASSR